MASCLKIEADILKNCQNMVMGIKDTAYLINIDDIDKDLCTFDPSNPVLLTQLVLNSTSPVPTAFKIEGYNYSNEHKTSMVKKTYYKAWEHDFIFRIFDNTPEIKEWLINAAASRFVVVQENVYNKDITSPAGRTVFEVLGWDFGLEINAAERDAQGEELAGGWLITSGCSDKMKESKPPLAFFVGGSLTSTRAAIAALL
jgi:hypothetical protein